MSIEVVVVIISGILGLAITVPLWIECVAALRLARQLDGSNREGIVAVAAEDLVHESVRLAILLIFVGAGALTGIESERIGRLIIWALAGIPALVAAGSLYAHKTRRDVRRTIPTKPERP